jgi:hypothetical protein
MNQVNFIFKIDSELKQKFLSLKLFETFNEKEELFNKKEKSYLCFINMCYSFQQAVTDVLRLLELTKLFS